MTLIAATIQGTAGFLITDAASCHADGTVARIASKVVTLPGVVGAVAFEGLAHPDDIAEMADGMRIKTARALVRNLGALATELKSWTLHWYPNEPRPDVLLRAVVYDPEVGPSAWVAHSGGRLVRPGTVAGEPRQARAYWNYGNPAEALRRPVDMTDEAAFDVETDGLSLAEAARCGAWDVHSSGHRVGGFVELTTVGRAGVHTRRLRQWRDKVGQLIKPASLARCLAVSGRIEGQRKNPVSADFDVFPDLGRKKPACLESATHEN